VRILVKAFPQHREKYEETVCFAGVTDDHRLIRLYPITYRRLAKAHQFNRYDLIEALATKASNDNRPESYRVDHDTIQVIERGKLTDEAKVRLWRPHITASLTALQEEHSTTGRSLGIIKPDPGSLEFFWEDAEREDQEDIRARSSSSACCAPASIPPSSPSKASCSDFSRSPATSDARQRVSCGSPLVSRSGSIVLLVRVPAG
jgi:hypothetical protein